MYIIIDREGYALYVQSNEPINGELFTEIPLNNEMVKPKLVDGIWIEKATAEVPQIVTNAQFRLALIESGQSISNINAFINSKEEPIRDVLNSLWEYANHFERQNPQLIQMATLLGLTSEKLDNLFILANTK